MATKICAYCGKPFLPRPQIPNQHYCSSLECQRARKRRWQQNKMQSDSDYRENQLHSQRAWLDRHPEYWRNYRDTHPEYVKRNRFRQRSKNEIRQKQNVAKMDTSTFAGLLPGLYRIVLVSEVSADLDGRLIVELTPVCAGCPCKKDAYKDRT